MSPVYGKQSLLTASFFHDFKNDMNNWNQAKINPLLHIEERI
jgi:hypothetical protein